MLKIREIGATEWVDLPVPDFNGGLTRSIMDIDASTSGRDSYGNMHRDRVATKRKLACVWTNRYATVINQIIELTGSTFFELKYTDLDGTNREGVFYVGDRTAPVYTEAIGTIYGSFKADFIER